MPADPAEGLAVKPTQVAEPHAADGQHRLAVTPADFKTPVLTLKTQTHQHDLLLSITTTCSAIPHKQMIVCV